MTSLSRIEILEYILSVIGLTTNQISYMEEEMNIKSIGILINTNEEAFQNADTNVLKTGDYVSFLLFANWMDNYKNENGAFPQDWTNDFSESIWDNYILEFGIEKAKVIVKSAGSSLSSPEVDPIPSQVDTPKEDAVEDVATTSSVSSGTSQVKYLNTQILPSIKIDVRSYPEFDGNLKNWRAFKHKFTSIATLHNIGYILKEEFVPPTNPGELAIYETKNCFLQSILEYSLSKSTALTRVKLFSTTQDGRKSWLELNKWFAGQGSIETLAKTALQIITTHRLTNNSFGGAETYLEKFETALQDLDEIGKPYDSAMAKIHFLTNIQDDDYKIVKETLEMDDSKSYHDCLVEIRRKSIAVEGERKRNGNRRANNQQKSGKQSNKSSRANNLKKRLGDHYVPPEKWKKMSQNERNEHIKKSRAARNNNSGASPGNETNNNSIPKQYSQANNMSAKEKELYEMMKNVNNSNSSSNNDEDTLTQHERSFLNMVRSMGASANMLKVQKNSIPHTNSELRHEDALLLLENEDWLEDKKEMYGNILKKYELTHAQTNIHQTIHPSEYNITNMDYISSTLDKIIFQTDATTPQSTNILRSNDMYCQWYSGKEEIECDGVSKIMFEKRSSMATSAILPDPVYDTRASNALKRLVMTNNSKKEIDTCKGEILIDGGCDTSLIGNGFFVESTTDRTVTVQGFQADMTMEKLPIVTGVTAIDLPQGTTILELNEAIHVDNNSTSLLSTFQARENGINVNDTALRHGGKQNLEVEDTELPLAVRNGLLVLDTRMPTASERANCPRITLTADSVWNVDIYDDATKVMAVLTSDFDPFREAFESICLHTSINRHVYASKTQVEEKDLKELQAKLGWMPLRVLEKTLKVTTRLAKNNLSLPMRQHFKSRFPQLNRNRLRETYSTDTIFSSVQAIHSGATCMQIFCGKTSKYSVGYGMKSESHGADMLETFIADVGAPYHMLNDNAKMETSRAWNKILQKYNISRSTTEPYHPHQNPAERRIQDIKRVTNTIMDHTGAPDNLWELATLYGIKLLNHTASEALKWVTPIEKAFGTTPDISALLQFSFYEPVMYLDRDASFPHSKELRGRFVGIADHTGDALTYRILTEKNTIIARSVMRSALNVEHMNRRVTDFGNRRNLENNTYTASSEFEEEFDIFRSQNIHHHWDGSLSAEKPEWDKVMRKRKNNDLLQTTTDITGNPSLPTVGPDEIMTVNPEKLIGFKFVIDTKDQRKEKAEVIDWNKEGQFILQFINGGQELMNYNDLVNHYSRVSEENADLYTFSKIKNHKYEDGSWFLEIEWDSGEVTWEPIQNIKQSDPLTLAKYAFDKKLYDERGWKWTKRYSKNPKKFVRMAKIFASQRKKQIKVYKFGVEIPRNLKHALMLDQVNGDNKWGNATDKEVDELLEHQTFIVVDKFEDIPVGYAFVPLQFVYDNKFDGRRKGRLVACGNLTNPDTSDIYSGVVGIENVRIIFVIAQLNGLIIIAADVCNAYLNGLTKEKLYTQIDYGKLKGKWLLISKALYGLKTSAARWADDISDTLRYLGFEPCMADTEIWMRDAGESYEYVAVYVDDLIIAAKNPMKIIKELEEMGEYKFKGVGEPEYYLGGDISRKKVGHVSDMIVLSAKTYISNICDKIERMFDLKLRNYHSPLEGGYHPELDTSDLLVGEDISKYRMLVGSLNWSVTLGRVDVMFAAVTMARYNQVPRNGHMKVMFRIFGYLKNHARASLKMDVSYPDDPIEGVMKVDWKHLYPNQEENIPHKVPEPKGKPIRLWAQFDADHAHDLETRRSVTGVFIFINNSLVKWYAKRQNTVETSTYGSEIVACRRAVELLIEMKYTLKMLGVKVLKEVWMYGDNLSVINNVSKPESTLKKKHHSVSFNYIRSVCSWGWLNPVHISSEKNTSDILTKALNPAVLYGKLKGWMFGV